jgi:imidazolonepropionase-like amidohydrolase
VSERLSLANARLIDCVTLEPRAACVDVAHGRIAGIRDGGRGPREAGATVVDCEGMYVLPGLWDAHVHLEWPRLSDASAAELTLQYAANAQEALTRAGVTAIRTAGTPHLIDVALKRAFEAGRLVGPRIFAGGWFLTTTAGHALATGFARPCDGPEAFVTAIREQIQGGVDHIKLNLTGGIIGPAWDRHWHSFFTPAELEAAFGICRQRGVKVMAHAANAEAVKAALRLGAHSIEHGYTMDDEALVLFRERDAWYVPTLGITHLTPAQASTTREKRYVEERSLPVSVNQRAEAAVGEHRAWFQRALAAGVKMALGSDLRPLRDAVLLELGLWVKDGATPGQALLAATRHAAELCGAAAELGTVEVGKKADLIVVRGNPLDDIEQLGALALVVKDGHVVADHRARWPASVRPAGVRPPAPPGGRGRPPADARPRPRPAGRPAGAPAAPPRRSPRPARPGRRTR